MLPISRKDGLAISIDTNKRHTNIRQRAPYRQNYSFPFQYRSSRNWRWWHLLVVFLAAFGFVELILFFTSATLLAYAPEPIRFAIQKYPAIPYTPLDTSIPIPIQPTSKMTVYHVTKEFGPATMGGMGTVLTSLAQAQLRTGYIQPYIVMPYYSFLRQKDKFPVKRHTDLVTTFRDANGKTRTVDFKVFRMVYYFNPDQATDPTSEKISVFLIGPGRVSPLNKAFQANVITQIYSSPDGLPQEWMYQYFDKAAAAFLIWKTTGKHEQSLFAPFNDQPKVDVVHLHGATNAYVAKHIKEVEKASLLGPHPPAIVYTMHDYLDELQYTNTVENVEKFLSSGETKQVMAPYTYGNKVFMAPFGIDAADSVTFVSRSMAKDMVEGRLDFYLKEVVMKPLLNKAQNRAFYGISNGVDFNSSVNPFTDKNLTEYQLEYPTYAKDLIELKLARGNSISSGLSYWALSTQKADFVTEAKHRAKEYLIETGWLKPQDIDKPLVLFLGRFQYNKGLETFDTAVKLFKQHGMKFAIIGQPNNYPFSWVKRLKDNHPDDIVLIYEDQQQIEWLSFFRAAADFVYVPSITESFGLVAAEGLLFGSFVISTGAGGMGEFLIGRPAQEIPNDFASDSYVESNNHFNSYLFDDLTTLSIAISQASTDYNNIKANSLIHEASVLRMMQSAFALGWSRGGDQGPVYEYLRVYQKSVQYKRSTSLFDIE